MAELQAENSQTVEGGKGAGKAVDDKGLRHVEADVLISSMVRKKAHEVCFEPYVREFEDCVRGRTISMVWKCRPQNRAMQACLRELYTSEEFHEQCKEEYLRQREEFRRTNVPKKEEEKTTILRRIAIGASSPHYQSSLLYVQIIVWLVFGSFARARLPHMRES